jgi:hypothetical protein
LTCIVATSEGIWADRRVTGEGGARFRPARKVVRGEDVVAAFCGSDAHCTRAILAVRRGLTDVSEIAALSDGVVVSEGGRWELSDGIAVRVPARVPIAVNGSGYAEVQAYLYGAGQYDPDTIRRALRYVSRVRVDCGDGIDALFLRR